MGVTETGLFLYSLWIRNPIKIILDFELFEKNRTLSVEEKNDNVRLRLPIMCDFYRTLSEISESHIIGFQKIPKKIAHYRRTKSPPI